MTEIANPALPPAEPLSAEEEHEMLELLRDLRRMSAQEKEIDRIRKEVIYPQVIPLLKRVGSRPMTDPMTGDHIIAGVRAPETLTVDYDKLVALCGEEVANSVCKPPQVDTKDDGLFQRAVQNGTIPMEIVAEVATFKASAEHVGWSKPR